MDSYQEKFHTHTLKEHKQVSLDSDYMQQSWWNIPAGQMALMVEREPLHCLEFLGYRGMSYTYSEREPRDESQ